MKKWMISLVLVMALLLGAILGVSAAETSPRFTTVSLTLNTSIAINFKVPYADINGNFTKAEFLKDGKVVQTISTMPTAGSDGYAAFAFTALSPRELGKDITARLYDASGAYTEVTTTVLKYCNRVLADTTASETLKRLVVDLLNYGAAYQIYKNDNVDNLANAGLTAEQNALATDFVSVDVNESYAQSSDVQNPAATWYGATLILNDSIMMNFWFQAAAGTDGLVAKVTLGDQTWEINKFTGSSGMYKIAFDQVNPSQMSEPVKVVICDASGNPVSNTLTYSIEDYVANTIASTSASDSLKALVKAMACYGKTGFSWQKETTEVITRADMEEALAEVAWTYYALGKNYQYDSVSLNNRDALHLNGPLCGYCHGFSRLTLDAAPEFASSHESIYTVCSGYCFDVYHEAFDYSILGNKFNCLTMTLWRNTSYPDDMAVLRWHSKGEGVLYNAYDTEFSVSYENCWYDSAEVLTFFQNYETTMRPGDIIVFDDPGHAMLYIGNGIVLDAGGAGKYNMVTGKDAVELNGTCAYNTVEDLFLNANNTNFYVGGLSTSVKTNCICVIRPLNVLTKDDGDGDPSNDLLNRDYELDAGLLKTRLESDPTPLKTKNFTIEETTYTRMKYPSMKIDRTVNITPYGTAIKGETLTYTVAITNGSNNANYTSYQGSGYTGTAYDNLSVREIIPAGTELVSATEGYILDGDVLRWTVDIEPGATLNLTYTVKVTGAIGTEIVSGGGYVADLATNTIINRIGGQKLPETKQTDVNTFFAAGRESWNSNDGYHISAATTEGTKFAERIYNEALGMDLQLPEVQELANLFFEEKLVQESYGYYLYYNSTGVTRYMYQLKDASTIAAADKVYYDMLVPGYYGGVWVWSDMNTDTRRTLELREEYLELGDILVYMTLQDATSSGTVSATRNVIGWRILVYLGENRYASLDSDGRLLAVTEASAHEAAFSYDMFVCLRPSQAYENVNTEVGAFDTANRPTLTDADKYYTYVSNPSKILLNDYNAGRLAAIDPATAWTKVNGPFIGQVYSQIGIDVVTDGTENASFADLMKSCFDENPDSKIYEQYAHDYTLKAEPVQGREHLYDMLLNYGGNCFDTNAAKPLAAMSELHPGDVLMIGARKYSFYVTAVYQGNGNFVVNVQSLKLAGIPAKNWFNLSFASEAEFTTWFTSNVTTMAEARDVNNTFDDVAAGDLQFENYVVLRPSRAYPDINALGSRDITDGALTQGEMDAIAALNETAWSANCKSRKLSSVLTWVYKEAGINVQVAGYADVNHVGALKLINENDSYFSKMLLPGSLGENVSGVGYDLMKTGDILLGWTAGTADMAADAVLYYIAVYQGNDDYFVIYETYDTANASKKTSFKDMTGAEFDAMTFKTRFAIRPERLAIRDITDHALIETERIALKQIGTTAYDTSIGANLNTVYPWMYKLAGINVQVPGYQAQSINTVVGYLFDTAVAPYGNTPTKTTEDAQHYQKMRVENCWGGNIANPTTVANAVTNMQIGDLVCARVKDGSTNYYYVALYQGENFLVVHSSAGGNVCEVMTAEQLDAVGFYYWYTLRPEQLVTGSGTEGGGTEGGGTEGGGTEGGGTEGGGTEGGGTEGGGTEGGGTEGGGTEGGGTTLRTLTASGLTREEKAAISAVTVDQWLAGCASRTLQSVLPWVYEQAGIDLVNVTGYAELSVDGVRNLFYTNKDDTTAGYTYYNSMLIEDSLGVSATGIGTSYYQEGDVFCGKQSTTLSDATAKNLYYVAVYQGNNNFIVFYDKVNADNTAVEAGSEVMTADTLNTMTFDYRYVLRPELVALRKMVNNGTLSATEEAAISALTAEQWLAECKSRTIQGVLPWVYKAAGIDVIGLADYPNASVASINERIQVGADTTLAGYEYYNRILLAGSYTVGGTATDTLPTLEIGDILCGYELSTIAGKHLYYVALYQGNGKFLSVYDVVNAEGTDHEAAYSETLTEADLIAKTTSCRYVLRPKQLGARSITTGALTTLEQSAIASLTVNDWLADNATNCRNLNYVLPWVYKEAGIDLKNHANYTSKTVSGVREPMTTSDGYYSVMLVADTYVTTSQVGPSANMTEWQTGDIFCGYITGTGQYYVAICQGNNNFLTLYDKMDGATKVAGYEVFTLAQLQAITFRWSYVLRPSQLVTTAG